MLSQLFCCAATEMYVDCKTLSNCPPARGRVDNYRGSWWTYPLTYILRIYIHTYMHTLILKLLVTLVALICPSVDALFTSLNPKLHSTCRGGRKNIECTVCLFKDYNITTSIQSFTNFTPTRRCYMLHILFQSKVLQTSLHLMSTMLFRNSFTPGHCWIQIYPAVFEDL